MCRAIAERVHQVRRFTSLLLVVVSTFLTVAAYPPAKPTVGVISGVLTTCGSVEIAVSGFSPGETVQISLGSISVPIVVGPDGSGTVSMTVPTTVGTYSLTATGATSGSSTTSQVTLTACAVDPSVPVTTVVQASPASTARLLPVSGSNVSTPTRVGLSVLAIGIALAAVGYRRRRYAH